MARTIMRFVNQLAFAALVLAASFARVGRADDSRSPDEGRAGAEEAARAAEGEGAGKVLRHAVFFKFKDGTSDADEAKIVDAFDALPKKIATIKEYQRGKNVSPLGLDDGLTHCFLLTFADEAGRAEYLPHPDHKAFGKTLGPHLDKVFVLDYWGQPEKTRAERELKHALCLKFKDSASEAEVKEVEEAIAALPSQCETIKSFEWGKNNSPEKHDDGFTHCFMFTFDDAKALKAYADAPAHKAIVGKIMAIAEKGRVMDFWTAEKGK
jgi:Stress responsive A/B Barrel Domain